MRWHDACTWDPLVKNHEIRPGRPLQISRQDLIGLYLTFWQTLKLRPTCRLPALIFPICAIRKLHHTDSLMISYAVSTSITNALAPHKVCFQGKRQPRLEQTTQNSCISTKKMRKKGYIGGNNTHLGLTTSPNIGARTSSSTSGAKKTQHVFSLSAAQTMRPTTTRDKPSCRKHKNHITLLKYLLPSARQCDHNARKENLVFQPDATTAPQQLHNMHRDVQIEKRAASFESRMRTKHQSNGQRLT